MGLLDLFSRRYDGRAGDMMPPVPTSKASAVKRGATGGAVIALILAGLIVREGGYVDHPSDRGGKTKYGVTEAVARDFGYAGHMRDLPLDCGPGRPICAKGIYTTRYIDAPGYRPLASIEPAVLDELVDSAVLHGPPRASRWFQQALNDLDGAGLAVDGNVGARTVAAYQQYQARAGRTLACRMTLDRMDAAQSAFFDAIVRSNPSQRVFLRGWKAHRIGNVDRRKCVDYFGRMV